MIDNDELLEVLDFLGLDFEVNSPRAGLQTQAGDIIPYEALQLPSERLNMVS